MAYEGATYANRPNSYFRGTKGTSVKDSKGNTTTSTGGGGRRSTNAKGQVVEDTSKSTYSDAQLLALIKASGNEGKITVAELKASGAIDKAIEQMQRKTEDYYDSKPSETAQETAVRQALIRTGQLDASKDAMTVKAIASNPSAVTQLKKKEEDWFNRWNQNIEKIQKDLGESRDRVQAERFAQEFKSKASQGATPIYVVTDRYGNQGVQLGEPEQKVTPIPVTQYPSMQPAKTNELYGVADDTYSTTYIEDPLQNGQEVYIPQSPQETIIRPPVDFNKELYQAEPFQEPSYIREYRPEEFAQQQRESNKDKWINYLLEHPEQAYALERTKEVAPYALEFAKGYAIMTGAGAVLGVASEASPIIMRLLGYKAVQGLATGVYGFDVTNRVLNNGTRSIPSIAGELVAMSPYNPATKVIDKLLFGVSSETKQASKIIDEIYKGRLVTAEEASRIDYAVKNPLMVVNKPRTDVIRFIESGGAVAESALPKPPVLFKGVSTTIAVRPIDEMKFNYFSIAKDEKLVAEAIQGFKLGEVRYIKPNEIPKYDFVGFKGKKTTEIIKLANPDTKSIRYDYIEMPTSEVARVPEPQPPSKSLVEVNPFKKQESALSFSRLKPEQNYMKVEDVLSGKFTKKSFNDQLSGVNPKNNDYFEIRYKWDVPTDRVNRPVLEFIKGEVKFSPLKETPSKADILQITKQPKSERTYWWNEGELTYEQKLLLKNQQTDRYLSKLNVFANKYPTAFGEQTEILVYQGIITPSSKPVFSSISSPIIEEARLQRSQASSSNVFTDTPKGKTYQAKDIIKEPPSSSATNSNSAQTTILETPEQVSEGSSISVQVTEPKREYKSGSDGGRKKQFFNDAKYEPPRQETEQVFKEPEQESKVFSDTKQSFKQEQRPLSDVLRDSALRLKFGILSGQKQKSKLMSDVSSDSMSESDLKSSSLFGYDVSSMSKSASDSMSSSMQSSASASKSDSKTESISKSLTDYKTDMSQVNQGGWWNDIKKPTEEKPIAPKWWKSNKENQESLGFIPEVKIKGKYVAVTTKILTQASAFALGAEKVGKSALRTFRLVPVLTKEKPTDLGYLNQPNLTQFYRKKSGVFVEKSKFAIDTSGEKSEITAKGIEANRKRSWFNDEESSLFK
jgi:hypothetical protein